MSKEPSIVSKHAEKGRRLLEFYDKKGYKYKSRFADALNIFPQDLNKYFEGIYDPVNLTEALINEGCNIVWLVTGIGDPISVDAVALPQFALRTNKPTTSERVTNAIEDLAFDPSPEARKTRFEQVINEAPWTFSDLARMLQLSDVELQAHIDGGKSIFYIAERIDRKSTRLNSSH